MLRRLSERLEFTKGLGFRLGSLLSVAILPIGLILVIQTLHLSREYERSAEIALLGRTAAAAAGERALLQGALGSADALGLAILETLDDPGLCSEVMSGFVESTAIFAYAGFTDLDGRTSCSSVPGEFDLSDSREFRGFLADPGTFVTSSMQDPVLGMPIVAVMQPLYRGSQLLGYTSVAMSHDLLRSSHQPGYGTEQARILTFNNQGQILSVEQHPGEDIAELLPEGQPLTSLVARSETTFRTRAANGETRVFSIVPVVPGLVYTMGSWNTAQSGVAGVNLTRFTAFLLPMLLWVVSLVVAYFAVYRLVLRHIKVLRQQMRRFAIADRDKPPPVLRTAPAEIADMSQTFHNMARILIRDEVALESAVNEKTVLLKEVHHRVKNNLQLIASIINMQIRLIDHDHARRVLRSVQDRVAALASIYRNLYQAEHLDSVEAGRLISEVISQMGNASVEAGSGLHIETRIEPLNLVPDQAVPLSLLATEAFTNALKYAAPSAEGAAPWVRVVLVPTSDGQHMLEIANSTSQMVDEGSEGTGLGSQLIEAFAMQLDGEAVIEEADGRYVLRLCFTAEKVHPAGNLDLQQVVLTSAARQGARH